MGGRGICEDAFAQVVGYVPRHANLTSRSLCPPSACDGIPSLLLAGRPLFHAVPAPSENSGPTEKRLWPKTRLQCCGWLARYRSGPEVAVMALALERDSLRLQSPRSAAAHRHLHQLDERSFDGRRPWMRPQLGK